MVYAAQPIGGCPVKIGHSADVPARVRQLEAHYGRPLAVLATMPGGRDEEQAIHQRFAHLRLGRTEQFRPAADLMEFLGRPLLVGPDPEATSASKPVRATLAVHGRPAWRAWIREVGDHVRMDVPDLIDRALVEFAKRHGFLPVPPKR